MFKIFSWYMYVNANICLHCHFRKKKLYASPTVWKLFCCIQPAVNSHSVCGIILCSIIGGEFNAWKKTIPVPEHSSWASIPRSALVFFQVWRKWCKNVYMWCHTRLDWRLSIWWSLHCGSGSLSNQMNWMRKKSSSSFWTFGFIKDWKYHLIK